MSLSERFRELIILPFISSIVLSLSLFFYVLIHDDVLYALYEVAVDLQTQGTLNVLYVNIIENVFTLFQNIPGVLDLLWFGSFLFLVLELIVESYYLKREGFMSVFSLLTLGSMVVLFLTNFFVDVGAWFREIIITDVLYNTTVALPFFTWYTEYIGIINVCVVVACIVANFVPLDILKFNTRKDQDLINDEL